MPYTFCQRRRSWLLWTVLVLTFSGYGCGHDAVGKTYPVTGQILLDGQPWTADTTVILFKPELSRGNQSSFSPSGGVDAQGRYELTTGGKKGAPAGWYRVLVTAHSGTAAHPSQPPASGKSRPPRPVAQSLLPAKYGQERTSDLLIEVVEAPADGAYNLQLTSK